jgi:hypothetical protein
MGRRLLFFKKKKEEEEEEEASCLQNMFAKHIWGPAYGCPST